MGGMGYVASIGMAAGKPLNLMDMYDADGKACGREGTDYEEYPFLYFWLPITGQFHKRTCVKECMSFMTDAAGNALAT